MGNSDSSHVAAGESGHSRMGRKIGFSQLCWENQSSLELRQGSRCSSQVATGLSGLLELR